MVYAYLRQSSTEGDRSISCEQQLENINNFAKEKGWTIKQSFEDKNVSGRLYSKQFASLAEIDLVYKQYLKETKKEGQWRTGLGQLFDQLKDNDIIIVDDLTRFYRPLTNSYLESALTQFLFSKQIRLFTVKNGEVNLNNFNDSLINALQNRINDNQLYIQRKKAKDSFKRLYNAGELKQGLVQMVGYKPTGRKKEVEVDPVGAQVVKYVYKSYIEGKSILSTIKELNEKFNYSITVRTFKTIIQRPLYCGYMFNKSGELVKAKQVEGKEIIDFQTWKLANEILNNRKTQKFQVKKYPNHYTSLVKCGKCGSTMTVIINEHGKYISFRCISHITKKKDNCKISITANTEYNKGLSLDDALEPILIISLLKKLNNSSSSSVKEQFEQKQVQLNNLITQEQKFTELFFKGLLDSTVYETNLTSVKAQKSTLQQELIQLQQELQQDDTEHIRMLVNKIVGRSLSFEQYQELIPLTIKQIEVFEQEIKVKTFFGDICIPRFKNRGILVLPNYSWKNTGTEFKIYYHTSTFSPYKPHKQIFTYNNFTIYLQED